MNPWQGTGINELAQWVGNDDGPTLGVVDGPVDTRHPAFAHRRVIAADRGDPSCIDTNSPACRHGTFVAGQLARLSPSSDLITHSLFCEAGSIDACPRVGPRQLAAAIEGLVDAGARIINMSVGLQGGLAGSLSSLHRAYRRARQRGVVLVAAAGNDGKLDANPLFRDPWVITVAAHDRSGSILPSSNRGGAVARDGLVAPGGGLRGPAAGGGDMQMSGTSAAAPLVTAGAALLWTLHPHATAEQIHHALLRPDTHRHSDIPPRLDLLDSHRWLMRQPAPSTTVPTRPPMMHITPSAELPPSPFASVVPQACACGGATLGFAYSTGQLAVRFPDEGDQKEFDERARVLGLPPTDYHGVLSAKGSRYLARRVCWVLRLDDQPVGILVPNGEAELTDLVEALSIELRPNPVVVATGTLGSDAPPSMCDGLQVPMVVLAELTYFPRDSLLEQIAKETKLDLKELTSVAELIWAFSGVWRQPGFDDEQRAKNFVVLRTTTLYEKAVELTKEARPFWLTSITATATQTEAGRSVVDVDSSFLNAAGQTQTWRARIDATNLFAFQSQSLFRV